MFYRKDLVEIGSIVAGMREVFTAGLAVFDVEVSYMMKVSPNHSISDHIIRYYKY